MKMFSKYYFCFIIYVIALTNVNAQVFDKCDQIDTTYFTNPTDVICGFNNPITINGSLDNATSDSNLANCQNSSSPTVWIKISVDNGATLISTSLTSQNSNIEFVWAIYRGDCDSLKLVPNNAKSDSIKCSNDDTNPFTHVIGKVADVNEYYIAITGNGIINNSNFTLSVWASTDCVACIGKDGCEPVANFSIKKRSSGRNLDDPLFCSGEEATICIDFIYDASGNSNWLHGLIPSFGKGWDMTAFDPTKIDVSPYNPVWFEQDGSECAPKTNELLPYLCTYYDPITGKLEICHAGCKACPCSNSLFQGALLPSGWFWNTNPLNENSCSPSSHYGIGSAKTEVSFCMDLKVKPYDQLTSSTRDLNIDFITTSDDVTGRWNDPKATCKLDFMQISPEWKANIKNPDVITAQNQILLQEGKIDIFVGNNENSGILNMAVDFIPNIGVSGMSRDTFYGGQGLIKDYLINNTDSIQVVTYIIKVIDGVDFECYETKRVTVTILPDTGLKKVNLTVFNDINKNGTFESNSENVLQNFRIFNPELNYSYITNSNGTVQFYTTKDKLPISAFATWATWKRTQIDTSFITKDSINYFYIGFQDKVDSTLNALTYIQSFARCNTATFTQLGVTNTSPRLPISGKIIYTYDTKINVSDSTDPPTNIDQLNRKIVWDFANLSPGNSLDLRHFFVAPGISTTSDSLAFTMTVILDSGDTLDHKRFATLLRCSYDPNDKSVYPDRAGNENYLLRTEDLQYTIRFQNIGNDTAFNVLIQDVLDPSLDINTLHVLYASHDLNTQAKGDSVYFIFDNIRLPDSLRSPVESNGFVIFNIKPKADLPENTQIYNQASIYFDQNEPIITHKILNTLVEKLPCPIDAIFIENSDITVNKDLDKYEWYNCVNDSLVFTSTIPQFTPTQNGSYYCVITGRFCNAKTKCIVYDLISSITDYTSTFVKIYPNPGQDRVTIELKDDVIKDAQIAAMTDTKGNHWPVESSRISDNMYSIDTANMPQGVYVIYILDEKGTKYMVKWIKI